MDIYNFLNPIDFRYYGRKEKLVELLAPYLSENAAVEYQKKVEVALVEVLAEMGLCSSSIIDEVKKAVVNAEEVYKEEDRIKHNVRALVNIIRQQVSDEAKPYVHFTTTSHDIICTADSARFKDFTLNVLVPKLIELQKLLMDLAIREKDTLQIGRTHGQHAEPITFGFTIVEYVSRLGNRILEIRKKSEDLRGKISGAVGAYNASSLFFDQPMEFEKKVLSKLNLKPSPHSTQIVEPEFMVDFLNAITSCFGVFANLADDMRHLQRSEIREIAEEFGEKQVGSSTMPHKRNPINFENVKSFWKTFMPRMITMYMDQISEHQRDLTNSATSRFIPEILAGLYLSCSRLQRTMSKLVVDKEGIKKNFDQCKDFIVAEPLYILLAAHNHPDAHEYVRELTLKAQLSKKTVLSLLQEDESMKPYLEKFTEKQKSILENPEEYTGIAAEKTEYIVNQWRSLL